MKFSRFLRSDKEYRLSRGSGGMITNGFKNIDYVEYGVADEMYKRAKEAARCYGMIGNIPMMLNKLYTTINYEERYFPYIKK